MTLTAAQSETLQQQKRKVQTQNTNIRLNTQKRSKQCCEHIGKKWHLKAENSYVKLRKPLKSSHLIVRLNAVSEEKSTVSHGKQFQMLTTRSVKNEDLTVLVHWRLNSL